MEVGWVGRNEKIPVRKKKKRLFFSLEKGELLADLKFQDHKCLFKIKSITKPKNGFATLE